MRARRLLLAGLSVMLLLATVGARADQVVDGSRYCDGSAGPAKGDGSPSQIAVHAKVLSRAFAKACRREGGLVTYLGTGTRRGVSGLMARRLPFVGSDVPLSTSEWLLMHKGDYNWVSPVHQIPLYVDGWAIAYNLPCRGPTLKLRSNVLGLMFTGVITKWNDRLLTLDNPWLETCVQSIRLARRSDDAAATDAFQDYLAKRNPNWTPYRKGLTPQRWPTASFACSALGDAGMVNCVSSYRGSIGYIGMATARTNKLKTALVENAGGSFVAPSSSACTAAAATALPPPGTSPDTVPVQGGTPWIPATLGDWSTVSITDPANGPDGAPAYPICSFSYVFALQNWSQGYSGFVGTAATRAVVDYLLTALRPSTQQLLAVNGYAALPANFRKIAEDGVKSISFFRFTTGPL
jgi:ABC-type phosphate transport system substrate-binding protein